MSRHGAYSSYLSFLVVWQHLIDNFSCNVDIATRVACNGRGQPWIKILHIIQFNDKCHLTDTQHTLKFAGHRTSRSGTQKKLFNCRKNGMEGWTGRVTQELTTNFWYKRWGRRELGWLRKWWAFWRHSKTMIAIIRRKSRRGEYWKKLKVNEMKGECKMEEDKLL